MLIASLPVIWAGFVLLAGLLLWFIIGARGKWYLKLATIIAVPVFMFGVWSALGSFTGWPTSGTPTASAYYYLYGYTVEPDPQTGDKGAIYIWMIPTSLQHGLLDYGPKKGEPRAFKLPYSRKTENQVNGANGSTAHGNQVMVKRAGGKKGGGNHLDKSKLKFYNLIRPQLPPKGTLKNG